MPFSEDETPSFEVLGGQSAPRASDSVGVRVLYRCSFCRRTWFQDGHQTILELEEATLQELVQELHANLAQLPGATCRLCLARLGGGAAEIDEYGKGEGGFGISWEIPGPPVIHAIATLLSLSWLQRQSSPAATLPGIVTRAGHLRAVLAWFVEQVPPHPQHVHPLAKQEVLLMQSVNRPGFGQTGTSNWVWNGVRYTTHCPPLRGQALLQLNVALPATTPFSFPEQFVLWQELVRLTLAGSVAGEQRA